MPHALSMPAPGFQAIILCGPGSSFPTFTANPDENPKALLPIANRPMVWYPIDFCYRMGVTSELFVISRRCKMLVMLIISRCHTYRTTFISPGHHYSIKHQSTSHGITTPETCFTGSQGSGSDYWYSSNISAS